MKRSDDAHRSAPDPGEPLLTCFDCQRTRTFGQLTLFPWWDERIHGFDVMYRCDDCLPKAHRRLLKQLAKNEEMLNRFIDFASRRVVSEQFAAAPDHPQKAEALEYARQIAGELAAHEAFVRKG
jgi:hypothetical protein